MNNQTTNSTPENAARVGSSELLGHPIHKFQTIRWGAVRRKIHALKVGCSVQIRKALRNTALTTIQRLQHAYSGRVRYSYQTNETGVRVTRVS